MPRTTTTPKANAASKPKTRVFRDHLPLAGAFAQNDACRPLTDRSPCADDLSRAAHHFRACEPRRVAICIPFVLPMGQKPA